MAHILSKKTLKEKMKNARRQNVTNAEIKHKQSTSSAWRSRQGY